MKKRLNIILATIFLIAIMLVNYTYYSYSIKPPSEKWSKEVKISSGIVKSSVKVLKFNGNYIITHDNGPSIKIIETDITGKILKANEINTGKFMNHITTFTDGDNLFISYVEPTFNSGNLYTITLNEDLKEINCEVTKDVKNVQQINNEMLLLVYSTKMEMVNLKTGARIVENASTKLVSGSKTSDGSYIICYQEDEKFLGLKIKNDKIIERYDLGDLFLISGMTTTSISSSCDERYIYVLIEIIYKGRYGDIQMMSYDKSNRTSSIKKLTIGSESYLYNAVAMENSGESAEFLIDANENFLDVKFRTNEIVEVHKATRMRNYAFNIGISGNTIVFIDGQNPNNVYLASSDEKFKLINNANRKEEAKEAFSISISHIINDIVMTPFYALFPLMVSVIPVVISTFIFYDSRQKNKRRVVLVFSYIMLILLKLWKVYEKCFQQYSGSLPEVLSNPVILILIMILISSICMCLAYKKFEKDEYSIDLWTFLKYAFIDTIISTMFYLPYIL
jgi:hypothetical protein